MLLETLKNATSQSAGQAAGAALWQFWKVAPDETAQELLDEGVTAIRYADFLRAEEVLARLTVYCPDFAEGWNQLAFALFLQEKYDPSREALEKTLKLEPDHFGALAGIGLVHLRQGDKPLALIWLRRALDVNPWLKERGLLQSLSNDGSDL